MTPVTIIGTVVAKPEARDELREILAQKVVARRNEEGCINYDFHVDAIDPCCFVLYGNWRSQADLDANLEMPHLKPLFSNLDRLIACLVEILYLEMISEIK